LCLDYQTEGFDIATGIQADIGLSKQFTNKLSKPHSDCVKRENLKDGSDSEFFKKTVELYSVYQQEACTDLCFQDYVISKCRCYGVKFPKISSAFQPCLNLPDFKCLRQAHESFYKDASNLEKCDKSCPKECESTQYNYIVSFADYPTKPYAEGLIKQNDELKKLSNNGTDLSIFKESILLLNIFYSTFDYTIIREVESITLTGFLGSIG
jgi:hypothetical protein